MWNTLRACAVSGHRNLNYENVADKTEQAFLSLIEEGYDTFLVGMAVGFDFLCFKILEKLREYNDIKIIACIPCPRAAFEIFRTAEERIRKNAFRSG